MTVRQMLQSAVYILPMILLGCSADNPDVYNDFDDLSHHEKEKDSYEIKRQVNNQDVLVMAIHGGSIESGTGELAQAIANKRYSFYRFEGVKQADNYNLHISSLEFNEPDALNMTKDSTHTLSIHGYESEDKNTYVGGLDTTLASYVEKELKEKGFAVSAPPNQFKGKEKENIVNRNKRNKGVQLEISAAQRKAFFEDADFTSNNRENTTDEFDDYVKAVQNAMEKSGDIG